MRTDVIRLYKDVHTWVGIISGLALFVAFYAGAFTMFETPLQRWATPPLQLSAPPALSDTPRLIEATLAAHPDAAGEYQIRLHPQPGLSARMTWRIESAHGGEHHRHFDEFASSFSRDGDLEVVKLERSTVAELIDVLHQQVGLPFDHEISMPIMGVIALLYSIALVSGAIILIPTLAQDLFSLRVGRNLKRMWLDAHNVLGIFSLPFHLVMALTAVIFAFHDQIYDSQDVVIYERNIDAQWAQSRAPSPDPDAGVSLLTPAALLERIVAQAPGFTPTLLNYRTDHSGVMVAQVEGVDPRYGLRGPTYGLATVDPYDGDLLQHDYLPGHQSNWFASVTSFFALHFGNYGGNPVRWGYLLLGLIGAFLFYSGNLLWIESRRKMARRNNEPVQRRSTRLMGSLTVGVSLGCISGISLTIAAAKWLPEHLSDPRAWHEALYYTAFLGAVAWALLRGAARSSVDLLYASAAATALIPVTSMIGMLFPGLGPWNHGDWTLAVDVFAAAGAVVLVITARATRRRTVGGRRDSIWHRGETHSLDTPTQARL